MSNAKSLMYDCGSFIAGSPNGCRNFCSATHACWVFDQIDVDGGAGKKGATQDCDEFNDCDHGISHGS